MYQQAAISKMIKGAVFLGDGINAKVYAVGTTGWVIKHAREKDGTLNYLQWCLLKQQRGEFMRGMPEIDFITLYGDGQGYSVGMKKYYKQTGRVEYNAWGDSSKVPSYLLQLIRAFEDYALDFLDVDEDFVANDCHSGNIMVDGRGGFVLTDPASGLYKNQLPDEFALSGYAALHTY